ncbi:hypothetical protein BV898_18872, partial [Hypsibius exemplaris]
MAFKCLASLSSLCCCGKAMKNMQTLTYEEQVDETIEELDPTHYRPGET